jgi:hypothetical protein
VIAPPHVYLREHTFEFHGRRHIRTGRAGNQPTTTKSIANVRRVADEQAVCECRARHARRDNVVGEDALARVADQPERAAVDVGRRIRLEDDKQIRARDGYG